MGNHSKEFSTYREWSEKVVLLAKFMEIHNIIRNDFIVLLNVTEKHKTKKAEFDSLYRACVKGLFSIIEADIFGLNNLDKYENYSDKDDFKTKFKKTFKQVCNTWDKTELQKRYFDSKYEDLKKIKIKRDELIHPKKVEHSLESSEIDFKKMRDVFYGYDSFINKFMEDFSMKVNLGMNGLL